VARYLKSVPNKKGFQHFDKVVKFAGRCYIQKIKGREGGMGRPKRAELKCMHILMQMNREREGNTMEDDKGTDKEREGI
jgi:hypothetical protein